MIVALAFVALLWRRLRWWQLGALVAVLALLGVESASSTDYWSPYYKIHAIHVAGPSSVRGIPTHGVITVGEQHPATRRPYPDLDAETARAVLLLSLPARDRSRLNHVLIVGAGTGNDVAVALSEGARHIDAVEIDPVIQSLGSRWNPDRPYQSPRVTVHINDGRAFIQDTDRRYDLILFALPDSLTLLPGQGNLRLENYLFTLESVRRVKSILEPGGTFAMYNYYEPRCSIATRRRCWTVFGSRAVRGGRLPARRPSAGGPDRWCRRDTQLRKPVEWAAGRSLATDDRPFPYLTSHSIPSLYLWVLALSWSARSSLVWLSAVGLATRMRRYIGPVLHGRGVPLLETKNVVQFALLFGRPGWSTRWSSRPSW